MKKVAVTKELKSIDGRKLALNQDSDAAASIKDVLRILIYALPAKDLVMRDSVLAQKCIKAIDESLDVMEFEDEQHEWLMKKVEDFGPKIFGVQAVIIKEALEKKPEAAKKQKD